ncbi:MAG: hypothetical protein DRI95_04485 [Bacteroidetes bacterium]|nr:MAG: hypothetical protein DRI95_04485 [Bacteroidota bacterium]
MACVLGFGWLPDPFKPGLCSSSSTRTYYLHLERFNPDLENHYFGISTKWLVNLIAMYLSEIPKYYVQFGFKEKRQLSNPINILFSSRKRITVFSNY